MHHFSDLLCSFQFFKAHASYFAIPNFTATDIRKLNFKSYLNVLLKNDLDNVNMLKTIIFTLVRTKLAKRNLNLPELKKFDMDMSQMNVKRHVNASICSYVLYFFVKQR